MTSSRRLATWVFNLRLEDLPLSVVDEAMRCIVDTTGVALAGSSHQIPMKLRSIAMQECSAGSATIWGSHPITVSPAAAAWVNGASAHVLDYDDTCYDGIVHATAAVWASVVGCGESVEASGKTVLVAFIAGVEAEYALGRALPDAVYFRGWWTSGVLGGIGAAVGAAKVLGLDTTAISNAISLAACQAHGLRAIIGTAAKPYSLGHAAQTGVQSAQFGQAGLDAPTDVFESERGFLKLFSDSQFDYSALALSERYSLSDPGIAFKMFPACSATQAATEAILELSNEHKIDPAQVAKIDCEVTPLVAVSLPYLCPTNATEAQFSLPYAAACALVHGQFSVDHLNAASIADPRLIDVMHKVSMKSDATLVADPAQQKNAPEGARVTIHMQSGRQFSKYIGAATGMPARPMSDGALDRKFFRCSEKIIKQSDASRLLQDLRSLHSLPTVTSLFRWNN